MKILIILRKFILFFVLCLSLIFLADNKKKKIGVISLNHCNNIGNNLLKYAIFIKLNELGFDPYIIGSNYDHQQISFLKKYTNCRIIKSNYTEIKYNEYDILMVNSDQTWRKFDKDFYDIAFLEFAKNWNTPKFIYGASLGFSQWTFTKKDEIKARNLLKNFSGISVREINSVKLIKKNLGFNSTFVLDPTLLIDKKHYNYIINKFKEKVKVNGKYIFTYIFKKELITKLFINNANKYLGFKIYNVRKKDKNAIEKFLYGIANSEAVITNSFHGTIFSIIFNKPFVSFIFKNSPKERLLSLKRTLNMNNRFFEYNQMPNISLLTTPLNINYSLLNTLKIKSINYLKKNLGLI